MRARLLSRTFVVGMIALASGIVAAQAPRQNQPQPSGRGFILGQVVDAGDGRPIPGALVALGGAMGAVEVGLASGEAMIIPNASRQVIADAAGHFLFREIGSGSYTMRATAPGYIAAAYGASRPGGLAQSVVFESDDERRGGFVIRMWRAASITGRIVDEFGEPSIGQQVRSFRRTFSAGRQRLATGGTATTDDRGMYRFSNLAPGDYVVAIMFSATSIPTSVVDDYMQSITGGATELDRITSERAMSGAPFPTTSGFRAGDHVLAADGGRGGSPIAAPADDGRVTGVPTTFYPGTTSVAQATVLTLASGEDRTGIDFQIRPRRAHSVSGVVTGPDGPVPNIGLRLLIPGAEEFSTSFGTEAALTTTDAAGRFTFLGVTSGTYTLQSIRVPRTPAPRVANSTSIEIAGAGGSMVTFMSGSSLNSVTLPLPSDPTLWAIMPVTIGETDLTNLSVTLGPGARLSGRLVFEGGEAPSPDILQRAGITISPMTGAMPSQVNTAQKHVDTNGRFATLGYPTGRYAISASVPSTGPGLPAWRFQYARLGGKDLTDDGLDVGTSDITDIELVFGTTTTEISGTVVDAKSQPDSSALVVVIPADSQGWKTGLISTRRLRAVRASTNGAYTFANLPPGEYFIAAIPEGHFESWQDPRNLETISRVAARISLTDGNRLSQRLTTVTSLK